MARVAAWRKRKREDLDRYTPWRVPAQHFDNAVGRWSILDDVRYATLIVLGVPKNHAAMVLGRTSDAGALRLAHIRREHAVLARLIEAPHPEYIWHGERLEALRVLIEDEGLSRSQAAMRLEVTKSAVIGAVQRHLPHLCKKKPPPCPSPTSPSISPRAPQPSPARAYA